MPAAGCRRSCRLSRRSCLLRSAALFPVVSRSLHAIKKGRPRPASKEKEGQPRAWVDAASRAVTRMRDLISSLLGYARAGSAPVQWMTADLGDVFASVVADLGAEIKSAEAEVTTQGPLPSVSCDPVLARHLRQKGYLAC